MLGVDPVSFVRPTADHVQAKLARKVIVLDRVITMLLCVDGRRDVTATFDQYHGMAFPGEGAAGDLF